jgi:putative membrane protein
MKGVETMMGDGYGSQGWGMGNDMGWGGWLMVIFVIGCLVLLGGLLVVLLRGSSTKADARPDKQARRPLSDTILDEQFARGEIDEEEYARRMHVLHSG